VTTGYEYQVLAAAAYLIPGLVWAILAYLAWEIARDFPSKRPFLRVLPVLALFGALNYAFMMVMGLVPAEIHRQAPLALRVVYRLSNVAQVAFVAVGLHLVRDLPVRDDPPRPLWFLAVYGSATLVGLLAVFPGMIPAPSFDGSLAVFFVIRNGYVLLMIALMLGYALPFVRRGAWRPGGLGEVRSADIILLVGGLLGAAGWVVVSMTRSLTAPVPPWLLLYDLVVGLGLAAPLAVRFLGDLAPRFLLALIMLVFAGTILIGRRALHDEALGSLLDVAAVVALVLAFGPGQLWLRRAIDYLLFRTRVRQREELAAFLHALPPELGRAECCRRALAELVRVLQLRGVAIVPADDTPPVAHGKIAVETIARVWPRATPPTLPPGLAEYDLELPDVLSEAFMAAEVAAVVPIASPRQPWGHLFVTTSLLGATSGSQMLTTLADFAEQLALVLDATDLFARAVAVERSLAHAEKLAAIGELAARIAHEIRNPVTAARSLAQQLAREPGAPFIAEHELILTELERVERQVAALLRFARRDEFRFEPVDLAELARDTVEAFRPRLSSAGIDVALEPAAGVTARADREKLRQVLVNLIENAIDALAGGGGRLAVAVARVNGSATLEVRDTGPGVPADALAHLFEPFFSLKQHGTGLGLAIAKRTIDAHGGRITAARAAGEGMAFHIELPLAGAR
jgi:signal transduction histidine kinase